MTTDRHKTEETERVSCDWEKPKVTQTQRAPRFALMTKLMLLKSQLHAKSWISENKPPQEIREFHSFLMLGEVSF